MDGSTLGSRRGRKGLFGLLTLALLGASLALAPVSAHAVTTGDYVAVDAERVLETRGAPFDTTPDNAVKATAGSITQVVVRGAGTPVPGGAEAVVVTVTGVESTGNDGYLTVWDCHDTNPGIDGLEPDPPLASNVNLSSNDIRPNTVISKIGTTDRICIFSRNATHLLVDITGYFPSGTGHYVAEDTPLRVLDTRPSGGGVVQTGYVGGKPTANQVHHFPASGAAEAVVLNVAGVDPEGGYVTVWDCHDNIEGSSGSIEPDPPLASSLNLENGIIAANLVITKSASADVAAEDGIDGILEGEVCFYTSKPTHLLADRNGYFPPGANYNPIDPVRVLETRPTVGDGSVIKTTPTGTTKPTAGGRLVLDLSDAAPGARAVVINVTGTQSNQGYVTVYPCTSTSTPVPETSNLNLVVNQTRANLVVTEVGADGEICFYTQNPTHLVADLVGYFPGA